MLTRQSSVVFLNSVRREQGAQPDLSLGNGSTLFNEITRESRMGAGAYLLQVQDHLQQPKLFMDFLLKIKELKDRRIDPPFFIREISEILRGSPDLIPGSVTILPQDCLLEVQQPTRAGSFTVTLRYPANTTVPVHIVCRRVPQEVVGFFGHPGPTPKPVSTPGKSALKRKRSTNIKRDAAVVFPENAVESISSTSLSVRQSKRIKLRKESEASMRGTRSSLIPLRPYQKLTVASVVALFTETLTSRVKRRRLMEYKEERAQLVLDTMQALVDVPGLVPSSRLRLGQALIKLSGESSLPPSCFSICGFDIDDFSPSDAPDGCFGEIYTGTFHQQRLCIKVVKLRHKANMNKAFKAFLKEGVTWGQISHPNILPFYGIYRLQDKYNRLSLVSPWLANGNVNLYLDNHPTADRLLLIFDIIQGVAHLHREGIVHGDLKGPNILVTKAGRACIADFGLATMNYEMKPNWTSRRSSMAVGGTLRWQAPELLESELGGPTTNSDVYSFGCVMYEVFTGEIPFYEVAREVRVMKMMLEGARPTRPTATHPAWMQWGLTEGIWDLIERCWDGDAERRPLAKSVVKAVSGLGPDEGLQDTRVVGDQEYLSPSTFRHVVHAKLNPLSEETIGKVARWLQEELSDPRR